VTEFIVVFAAVYVLNIIPAFAPPTWMLLSLIGFNHPQLNLLALALSASVAATLGRITLAGLSHSIVRNRFLNDRTKENIDVLKDGLERRKHQALSVLMFYFFTPLPSNYLFLAYGLTTLPIKLIAVPFFIGRIVSYAAWAYLGQEAYHSLDINAGLVGNYLGTYFIVTQIGFLLLIYLLVRIDWRAVLMERKFRWMK